MFLDNITTHLYLPQVKLNFDQINSSIYSIMMMIQI